MDNIDKQTTSPISGKKYSIPKADDKDAILDFINSRKDKINVAVQGLGFVGTVMSLVIANSDEDIYNVIGVDQKNEDSYWKIADINSGNLPVISSDPKVEEFFKNSKRRKNLFATYDSEAFVYADVILVDINLDVIKQKDKDQNISSYDVPLGSFKSAMHSIAEKCKPDVLILVETTVPPGTCREIINPIIKEGLEQRGLSSSEYMIGHSYERVMPGPNYVDSIKNFYRVYSGLNAKSADAVELFLKTIISTDEYPLTRLSSTESTEMAKVLENSYRAMNIAFIIEWSRFAESSGVNLYEVVDAIKLRPTHSNMMYPGIGVGGYCLTKDPLMASWSSEEFFHLSQGLQFSKLAVQENDKMPEYCLNFVKDILLNNKEVKNIGIMGVAYGPGIGDTRFSPVDPFIEGLKDTYHLDFHDPYVGFWEEKNQSVENDIKKFLNNDHDLIIICTGHRDYIENDTFEKYLYDLEKKPIIIDTVGILLKTDFFNKKYPKEKYFVLGNG